MKAAEGAEDTRAAEGADGADGAERMKVLVTGAAGQLGQAMVQHFATGHQVTAWTRDTIDLTRHREIREKVLRLAPAAIINCSGYNQVDQAEDQQQAAFEVNAFAVGTLARAAADLEAVLMHYSTDFVFAGTATTPYTELDRPEPQGAYAQSKLVGEWLAADAPRHYVLRVESLFGGPRTRSSTDRIADAVLAGEPAPVFVDRVVSPSFVADVVAASAHLLRTQPEFGVYHCVNSGFATWYDVGREIARLLGKPESLLKPISVRDVTFRASRPQFAALSNAKLADAGYPMPVWEDAMARYLASRTAA
jgi:dTDP-4-dehydrorhamnose reductase